MSDLEKTGKHTEGGSFLEESVWSWCACWVRGFEDTGGNLKGPPQGTLPDLRDLRTQGWTPPDWRVSLKGCIHRHTHDEHTPVNLLVLPPLR